MKTKWFVIAVAHACFASGATAQWSAPTDVRVERSGSDAPTAPAAVRAARTRDASSMLQGDGHSLWRELDNGAVIGMAAGAIIGTVIAWRDCGDDSWQILCFPVVLLDASTGALGGGVIGAGVAYIVHRRRHVPRSSAVKHAAVLLPIGSSARALHEPWKP